MRGDSASHPQRLYCSIDTYDCAVYAHIRILVIKLRKNAESVFNLEDATELVTTKLLLRQEINGLLIISLLPFGEQLLLWCRFTNSLTLRFLIQLELLQLGKQTVLTNTGFEQILYTCYETFETLKDILILLIELSTLQVIRDRTAIGKVAWSSKCYVAKRLSN